MSTQTIPMTRWQLPKNEAVVADIATAQEDDYALFSHPAINATYTLVFGVVATNPPLQARKPLKYVFGRRPASQTARFVVPWFESADESLGMPPATSCV